MAFSITPSHLIQHLYCARFTYFQHVLKVPQNEDKFFKVVKGRAVHELKARQNTEYLRQRIGVTEKHINQYLTNDLLRGEIDEVLLLKDKSTAPLDYKFAYFDGKVYDTYRTQLYCYAWLIESNYQHSVKKGYLVYTRSKNKLIEIEIEQNHLQKIKSSALELYKIVQLGFFPKATKFKKRCVNCTYRNICIK